MIATQVFLEEERKSFIDDYRLTACMNVLKWFVTNLSEQVIIIITIINIIIIIIIIVDSVI